MKLPPSPGCAPNGDVQRVPRASRPKPVRPDQGWSSVGSSYSGRRPCSFPLRTGPGPQGTQTNGRPQGHQPRVVFNGRRGTQRPSPRGPGYGPLGPRPAGGPEGGGPPSPGQPRTASPPRPRAGAPSPGRGSAGGPPAPAAAHESGTRPPANRERGRESAPKPTQPMGQPLGRGALPRPRSPQRPPQPRPRPGSRPESGPRGPTSLTLIGRERSVLAADAGRCGGTTSLTVRGCWKSLRTALAGRDGHVTRGTPNGSRQSPPAPPPSAPPLSAPARWVLRGVGRGRPGVTAWGEAAALRPFVGIVSSARRSLRFSPFARAAGGASSPGRRQVGENKLLCEKPATYCGRAVVGRTRDCAPGPERAAVRGSPAGLPWPSVRPAAAPRAPGKHPGPGWRRKHSAHRSFKERGPLPTPLALLSLDSAKCSAPCGQDVWSRRSLVLGVHGP